MLVTVSPVIGGLWDSSQLNNGDSGDLSGVWGKNKGESERLARERSDGGS